MKDLQNKAFNAAIVTTTGIGLALLLNLFFQISTTWSIVFVSACQWISYMVFSFIGYLTKKIK